MDDETIQTIITTIDQNAITVVQANTGSGKSTQIPLNLVKAGSRVFVGVPTNPAAQTLARYIHDEFGLETGFGSEGRFNYSDDTMLVYMTHGHLLNVLLRGVKNGEIIEFPDIDVLMVDEVHTGSVEVHLILKLWLQYAAMQESPIPLVVASATPPNMDIFGDFLVAKIDINIQKFPIELIYHDQTPASNQLYSQMAQVISQRSSVISEGVILAFVPGRQEALQVQRSLDVSDPVFPVYASLGGDEIKHAINYPGKKILIATNVMESSLTVDQVVLIVDSMMERINQDTTDGSTKLETVYESKSSAQQRCGRTGRTNPGVCYRMITQEDYNDRPENRRPEIERVSLIKPALLLFNRGLDLQEYLDLDQPEDLIENLQEQGLIDGKIVTSLGKLTVRLPLGILNVRFLDQWHQRYLDKPFHGLIMSSIIDAYGPGYFYIPKDSALKADAMEILQQFDGPDPMVSYINMLNQFLQRFKSLTDYPISGRGSLNEWATQHSVNAKKLRELMSTLRRLFYLLHKEYQITRIGMIRTDETLELAYPILAGVYPVFHLHKGQYYSENQQKYFLTSTGAYDPKDLRDNYQLPSTVVGLSTVVLEQTDGSIARSISLYVSTGYHRKQEVEPDDLVAGFEELFE